MNNVLNTRPLKYTVHSIQNFQVPSQQRHQKGSSEVGSSANNANIYILAFPMYILIVVNLDVTSFLAPNSNTFKDKETCQ